MTHKSNGKPKLPKQQLAILAVMRFAEPVASTSVYPYLPEMIESFGVPKQKVAKWAGITSSVFSLSQCVTAVPWGRASDAWGRKPAILAGLTCTMIASLFWGMSQNLAWAIAARTVSGAVNGNVGIIRTTVAEMVQEPELQPIAFSIMPLVWSIGSILGPSLGGFAQRGNMPWLWERSPFLQKFPFALPNLIASGFFLISITIGILFLKETLETRKNSRDYGLILGQKIIGLFKKIFLKESRARRLSSGYDEESPLLGSPSDRTNARDLESHKPGPKGKKQEAVPTLREVFTRQSAINLFSYSFLAMHSMAFDQNLAVFLHHERQVPDENNTQLPFKFAGGFGLDSARIGAIFTAYGIIGGIVQFIIFPPVAKKYGVLNCFRVTAITFPIVYLLTPYTALIQDTNSQQGAMFALMVIKCICGIFAFPCSTILLTNSAASLRVLGTLNGLAVSMSAIGRAAGPALAGAMFTYGIERGYVVTSWWVIALVALMGIVPTFMIVEMPGFGAPDDDEVVIVDSEEEEVEAEPMLLHKYVDHEDESSPGLHRRGRNILDGDEWIDPDDEDEEALSVVEGPSLDHLHSRTRGDIRERRMSSPIGIRGDVLDQSDGKKLSNRLGYSNAGQGAGGTSFS